MFKISLDALLVLDAIDRLGSFAAAAKTLYKVPSTISYTVSKLEQDLGVTIYQRSGPKVVLTTAGKELLKEGRYLLKSAAAIENRVKRVASGWETELNICMDTIFSPACLTGHIQAFDEVAPDTRLNFLHDSLSGTWEALLERRADLLIGAAGEGPAGGGYQTRLIGMVDFVFAVAPSHPLAQIESILGRTELSSQRVITVSDSVRSMPTRTVGLMEGQNTLSVPDMQTKLAFQVAGLGVGFVPEPMARDAIKQQKLIVKTVAEPRSPEPLYIAWRTSEQGEALKWWLNRLRSDELVNHLWAQS